MGAFFAAGDFLTRRLGGRGGTQRFFEEEAEEDEGECGGDDDEEASPIVKGFLGEIFGADVD